MKIIDIHTHMYPDAIARKATDSIRDFYQIDGGGMDGSIEMLRKRGAEAGISHYVVLPVSNTPNRVRNINEFLLNESRKYEDFTGFGTLHAGMDNIADEAKYILDKGLKGIKMHPDTQEFAIDDPRLFPAFEEIQGKIALVFHMGDKRYNFSHPAQLRKVMELFPRMQVIATHFGGYGMYEEAYEILHDKDCIFDVSSSMMFMEKGIPEKFINLYGAERMAFGTDYPLWDPVTETKRFLELNLTDEQFEQIGHKTAERFLRL